MRAKQPTSIDVAKKAGVSQTTVSFVLNGRHDRSIPDATRKRVLQAARELRYRSNRLSHGILRGKTGLVGVLMPYINDSYFSDLLSGISSSIQTAGHQMLLTCAEAMDDSRAGSELVSRLLEYRVEGIIFVSRNWQLSAASILLDEMLAKKIPFVIVDDRSHADVADCVVSDDVAGAESAVSSLIAAGHRRIAHISGGSVLTTAIDRRAGYEKALQTASIEIDESLVAGNGYEWTDGEAAARELMSRNIRPTAVFAANDILAVEFIKALHSNGLACPKDISVIGYGDTILANGTDLTSVSQDPMNLGKAAVELLIERIEQPNLPPRLIVLPTHQVDRGSVRLAMS